MANKKLFITHNENIAPENHSYHSIDLRNGNSSHLQQLGCERVLAVNAPPGWEIRRTGKGEKNHLDLMFIQSGLIEITVPGGSYRISAGQRVIIPSWLPRMHQVMEFCRHTYAYFGKPELFPHLKDISIRDCPETDTADFYVKQLLQNRPHQKDEPLYRSALMECLAVLFEREMIPENENNVPARSDELLNYIQHAPGNQLTVAAIAKRFNMSISAFRIFCHHYFNRPPTELISNIKMSRARSLLKYGNIPISEIAVQLGYSDRFAFSKAFVRKNRISPANYRDGNGTEKNERAVSDIG